MSKSTREHYTLGLALIKIDDYLAKEKSISAEDKKFLFELQNTIRTIDAANVGWLKKSGLMAQEHAKSNAPHPPNTKTITKKELQKEALRAHKGATLFTLTILDAFKKKIDNKLLAQKTILEKESDIAKKNQITGFITLLKTAQDCAEAVLANLKTKGIMLASLK